MKPSGIITFLSDFGLDDWFIAAVKGEILKVNHHAIIVDITHTVQPHDIKSAAFVLHCIYQNFPPGTVHLVVVDPGVGGTRRAIVLESHNHFFVGPDNGVLSYVVKEDALVYEIPISDSASATFHGRDLFAPVAGRLSLKFDIPYNKIPIEQCNRFMFPGYVEQKNNIIGKIVYVDRFGNCITNIPITFTVSYFEINKLLVHVKDCYEQGRKQELIAIKGSHGFFEISSNQGNAQHILNSTVDTPVTAYIQ